MVRILAHSKWIVLLIFFAGMVTAETSAQGLSSCKGLVGEKAELPFVVIGRVVDGEGRPVRNSSVSIDPRGSTEMLNPYESATTDENGCFKFVGFGDRKAQNAEWYLYISGRFGLPGIAEIAPPDIGHLQKLDSRYNGIPFVPGKRKVIDMGDVPVLFRYGSARLTFDDCRDNKCSSVIPWRAAMVSIFHCGSGKLAGGGGGFSLEQMRQYIWNEKQDLIYMLPDGNWRIEIAPDEDDSAIAATSCFDVEVNKVIDVPIKLIAGKK